MSPPQPVPQPVATYTVLPQPPVAPAPAPAVPVVPESQPFDDNTRDDLINPYWIEQAGDVGTGPIVYLPRDENLFFQVTQKLSYF